MCWHFIENLYQTQDAEGLRAATHTMAKAEDESIIGRTDDQQLGGNKFRVSERSRSTNVSNY